MKKYVIYYIIRNNNFRQDKHTMIKRFLSLLMAFTLCFSMLPPAALAEAADAAAATVQATRTQAAYMSAAVCSKCRAVQSPKTVWARKP